MAVLLCGVSRGEEALKTKDPAYVLEHAFGKLGSIFE